MQRLKVVFIQIVRIRYQVDPLAVGSENFLAVVLIILDYRLVQVS
jgi:hypothetical protein